MNSQYNQNKSGRIKGKRGKKKNEKKRKLTSNLKIQILKNLKANKNTQVEMNENENDYERLFGQ